MGQTWAGVLEFLEASLIPEVDANCATISAADVTDDPNTTASSLEVSISTTLVIQGLRGCNLANAS